MNTTDKRMTAGWVEVRATRAGRVEKAVAGRETEGRGEDDLS